MSNINQEVEEDDIPQEGPLEKKYRIFNEKENKIDMKLIMKTSLNSTVIASLSEEEKVDMIINLKVVHLEWLNIKQIQNLDVFTHLETLYLQYNQIEKIENLDMLVNLEYLALNNNKIKCIENLKHLKTLVFLNLADNLIEDFDENELPENLNMIKMKGNPCESRKDYMKKIFTRFPDLTDFEGEEVTPLLRMVALGQAPAHMLEYARKMNEINDDEQEKKETVARRASAREEGKREGLYKGKSGERPNKRSEGEKLDDPEDDAISEEDEEEDEEEDDEEGEEEEDDHEEEKEGNNREGNDSRREEVSIGFGTEGRNGNSDMSTAYSRASRIDESSILDSRNFAIDSDLTIMRERTEKLVKRMKERHSQQLEDALQEIKESRALYDDIIKVYKSQGLKDKY